MRLIPNKTVRKEPLYTLKAFAFYSGVVLAGLLANRLVLAAYWWLAGL